MTPRTRVFMAVFGIAGATLVVAGFVWRVPASWLIGLACLCAALAVVLLDNHTQQVAQIDVASLRVASTPQAAVATVPIAEPDVESVPAPQAVAMEPGPERVVSAPVQPAQDSPAGPAPRHRPLPDCAAAPVGVAPVDALTAFAHAVQESDEVLSAHMWLEDSSVASLKLVAACGVNRPSDSPQSLDDTALGNAVSSGRAVLGPEFVVHTAGSERTVWRFAVPLEANGARGVAALDLVTEEPDRELLTWAAAHLRASLTASLALFVAGEESQAARTLLETSRKLARAIDTQDVTQLMLESAVQASGADTASVMLLDGDELFIASAHGLPADVVESTRVAVGEGIAGWVLASGHSVSIEDASAARGGGNRHGVRSAVSVPIADEDGIMGVLNVGSGEFRARFSPTHILALETLGRIGAVALRNAQSHIASRDLFFDALRALAAAVEGADPFVAGRTDRVLALATTLANASDLTPDQVEAVRIAALFHDLGMARVGPAVTHSSGPLNTVERTVLRLHPHVAAEALDQVPALQSAVPIVLHHHEHYDGGGYRDGLKGDDIPVGARVLAVADAYVALTSDRPYRGALDSNEALDEIGKHAGTQFDPRVVLSLYQVMGAAS